MVMDSDDAAIDQISADKSFHEEDNIDDMDLSSGLEEKGEHENLIMINYLISFSINFSW